MEDKHAAQPFRRKGFASTAAIFANYGYRSICASRDMVRRGSGIFPTSGKSDYAGRHCIADLRAILEFPAWIDSMGRKRKADGFPGGAISIGKRMGTWAADFSHLAGTLAPGQEMAIPPPMESGQ